ncbi:MAG: RNA polymerase sigma factor [Hymenobacteraceae bacterium]|nr:RNA polymerase sigma factor [Hymenobacteraceae bacterium]
MILRWSARQQAVQALYEPVHERLNRFCRARVRGEEDARDVAAETVLRAYERFGELRAPGAFLAFLFGIAVRVIQERERRGRRWGLFSRAVAEARPSPAPGPDVGAEAAILYDALARLPEAQREAVILFDIADLSLDDIRLVQGGSLSGVKSRLRRGREALTRLLAEAPAPLPSSTTTTRYDA